MKAVCAALRAECEALFELVSGLSDQHWQRPTVFYEWSVYDEIIHCYYLDLLGMMSLEDAGAFQVVSERVNREGKNPDYSFRAFTNSELGVLPRGELLQLWRGNYLRMLDLFESFDERARMKWFGPDMSVKSFATARQMEVWAHGQDIYDLLGIRRVNTDRIGNIAMLGVRTYAWSFMNRRRTPPQPVPYVELKAPSGAIWTYNPPNEEHCVRGLAEEFCWIVTQRRNAADTSLDIRGTSAIQWLQIAQCFAGEPADGPLPGARILRYDD